MSAKEGILLLVVWPQVLSIAHFFQHVFPVPVLSDMRFWAYNCHLQLTNFWKKKIILSTLTSKISAEVW